MLKTIDRIQIATHDAEDSARGWRDLLGASFVHTDNVNALGAKRLTFQAGTSMIEFLQPEGEGPVARALTERGRPHLFAGGISTDNMDAAIARLKSQGVDVAVENGQAHFDAAPALGVAARMVLSPHADRDPVGRIDFLYEVTLLANDAEEVAKKFAALFELDESHFVPISSERFAYSGVLTRFNVDDLHRFEVITPADKTTTMGRFFERAGDTYYMCFAETTHLLELEHAATSANLGITIDRPEGRSKDITADQAWVHPPTLGGVMLGLSRPTMAWTWSGHPEWVEEIA